jgi:hypothetical protein
LQKAEHADLDREQQDRQAEADRERRFDDDRSARGPQCWYDMAEELDRLFWFFVTTVVVVVPNALNAMIVIIHSADRTIA